MDQLPDLVNTHPGGVPADIRIEALRISVRTMRNGTIALRWMLFYTTDRMYLCNTTVLKESHTTEFIDEPVAVEEERRVVA